MPAHSLVELEVMLTLFSCAFSLFKGGEAERIGAVLILTSYIFDDIAFAIARPTFPTLVVFWADFVLALSLLIVAIRYSSLWLGCAMVLQSVDLCSQGLTFSGDGLAAEGQLWLNNGISMLMLCCIVLGSLASWRRRVKLRSYPSAQPGRFTSSSA